MNSPTISVVLPAFNCEKYIGDAIRSVLQQTFADFEFIIVNDGSTDKTEEVILSFSDNRIIYEKNKHNSGLVYTLNKGVSMARGKYLARMDGDDISLPERFKKQLEYLGQNSHVDILATVVTLIDEQGNITGSWVADAKNISAKDIREQLPKDNCIAHPSVMGRTALFKEFGYNQVQSQAEDYDLWLRMINQGIIIHKLPEALLYHRILGGSFTRTKSKNVFRKIGKTQLRFAWHELRKGKLSLFVSRSLLYGCINILKGIFKHAKNRVAKQ